MTDDDRARERWRLVLGRFAEPALGGLDGGAERIDRALDFLYGREYEGRQIRQRDSGGRAGSGSAGGGDGGGAREGGAGGSVLTVPRWLREVSDLFPREAREVVTRHALDRYQMTELVTDPQVLRRLEPSYDLLKAVLTFRDSMRAPVLEVARGIVQQVVRDLERRLRREVQLQTFGRLDRTRRSQLKVLRNFDVLRTVRRNLKNYDRQAMRLVAEELYFCERRERRFPWDVIIAVDCSGSMLDSVIHAAVMAAIFHALPTVRVKLLAFDTAVVDLSEHCADPTEVLMSVQLGGGTDIGGALRYAADLVEQPRRTIVMFVTDFYEGGEPAQLVSVIKRLRAGGSRVLGLAALDADARPSYDRAVAEQCVAAGAEVAALTPKQLAEWVEQAIST